MIDSRTPRHRIEPDGGKRVEGGPAKELKGYNTSTARKQIKQFCALNTQFNTPLDATLAKRFVDFEVAQGDGPMCAQNLWDT